MNRVRTQGLIGLMVVLLVACSSSSGASPTPTPTPTPPPPTPSPSVAASTAASQAIPSFVLPSNAKELEALLPDSLGGHTLTKASMKGSDFVNQSTQSPELIAWLNSLGKSLNDISVAYAFDMSGTTPSFIFAFRVAGVDHTTLFNAMQEAAAKSSEAPTDFTQQTIAGKSVQVATTSTSGISTTQYVYGAADVIFLIETSDQATAQEALSHLP